MMLMLQYTILQPTNTLEDKLYSLLAPLVNPEIELAPLLRRLPIPPLLTFKYPFGPFGLERRGGSSSTSSSLRVTLS